MVITNRVVRRASRVVPGTVAGGAAAWGVYAVDVLGRAYTFMLVGAVAGALPAGMADLYRRTVRLTEVRLSVPQLSELTFVVNDDTRQVSWQLFVESVTRVSAQRLADGEGLIREALTSLYGLFATNRDILRAARPSAADDGNTVEYLAVNLLNRELRPFLSRCRREDGSVPLVAGQPVVEGLEQPLETDLAVSVPVQGVAAAELIRLSGRELWLRKTMPRSPGPATVRELIRLPGTADKRRRPTKTAPLARPDVGQDGEGGVLMSPLSVFW